eukprot:TRINITY_DN9013_c0_g2_i1.p1 TRINITY_DN9013_c0_g2~~TRINITY_DN9013_c0_g2_i1.p1  ORF type:complete len:762 (+),score=118.48 TRINITY_DN9013_c0_g2_i1:117-2402(+)
MRRVFACLGMAQMILAGWIEHGVDSLSGRYSMAVAGDSTGRKFLMSWATDFEKFKQTGCAQYAQSVTISEKGNGEDFSFTYSDNICIQDVYHAPRTTLIFPYIGSDSGSGSIITLLDFKNRLFLGVTTNPKGIPITDEYNISGLAYPDGVSSAITSSNTTLLFYYWAGDFFVRKFSSNGEPGDEIFVTARRIWNSPSTAIIGNLTDSSLLAVAFTERNAVKTMFLNLTSEQLIEFNGDPVVLELVPHEPNSFTYERAVAVTHPVGIFVVYCGSRNNETEFVLFGKLFESNGYKALSSFEFGNGLGACDSTYAVASSLDTVAVAWSSGSNADAAINLQLFYMTEENTYSKASTVYRKVVGASVIPKLTMMKGYQDRAVVVWNGGFLILKYAEGSSTVTITPTLTETETPSIPVPTPSPETQSPIRLDVSSSNQNQVILIIIIVTIGLGCLCALVLFCCYQLRKSDTTDSYYQEMGSYNNRYRGDNQDSTLRYRGKNWVTTKKIGRGAFGDVYEVLMDDGKAAAVKIIDNPPDLSKIKKEFDLVCTLNHPNVIKYFDTQVLDNVGFCILMEYLPEGSIASLIERNRGTLPMPIVKKFTSDIVKGLQYLHRCRLVHRDIKGANVLVSRGGCKLADFGCIRILCENTNNGAGTVVGTPRWMAPEVFQSGDAGYGPLADIWSVGCTVCEMLTGQPPWPQLATAWEIIYQIANSRPTFPSGISDDTLAFLEQLLAKNPSDRPTATEILSSDWLQESPEDSTSIKILS